MTLENCKRLLKHFTDTNQTERAEVMQERIKRKEEGLAPTKRAQKLLDKNGTSSNRKQKPKGH